MLKIDKTLRNTDIPLIKVKETTNEFQLLFPQKQMTMPLGHFNTVDEAIEKGIRMVKKLSASAYLLRKKKVKTNDGSHFNLFLKEMEIMLNVPPSPSRTKQMLLSRKPGRGPEKSGGNRQRQNLDKQRNKVRQPSRKNNH